METKNVLGGIVSLTVVVICVAVIMMPVLGEYTTATKTYVNEGTYFSLADADDAETHTIVISSDDLPAVTVDGTSVTSEFEDYTVVFGKHSILRLIATTGRLTLGGTVGEGTSGQWAVLRAGEATDDATIALTGTTLTVTVGETVTTIEDNWAYMDPEGDYSYCTTPCVLADSPIYGGGVTYTPFSSATVICFTGTSEELTSYGVYRGSPAVTLDSYTVNTSEVDGDLMRIDSIVFNCTQSETSKTATYTYFLAPKEITYDDPDYLGSGNSALILAIPVIVIASLVVAAVGTFITGRRD